MGKIKTTIFLFALLITAFLLLIWRCFYLQYFKSEHYQKASEKQQQTRFVQKPQRGTIFDCESNILAASKKLQVIFADPCLIKDPESTADQLESILKIPAIKIYDTITKSTNKRFVKILTGANDQQCSQASKITGIGIQYDWERYYPTGRLACHITGFTSSDNQGLEGLELKDDKMLSGSDGRHTFFADASRRPIRLKSHDATLLEGYSIILTIDTTIQQIAREELTKQYKEFEAESAIAIVIKPKTGAILAMVSLPDFDPNDIPEKDMDRLRNRAITDQFEPGSILKPIVVALALDDGVIKKNQMIDCENGSYSGKGFGTIGEYQGHHFGILKLREVLIKSSNIGMAKIGQKMGKSRLYNGLKLFRFGQKTGIELPGEISGMLWPPSQWTGYSVTRIPFGQEITVTALQILQAYCILANEGHYVQPFLVKAIINDDKIMKLKQPTPPVASIIKPEVAKWIINDPLVGVINEKENGGTGWRAKLEKWQVFGKTGTADMASKNQRGYDENAMIASFIAGAPVNNPQVLTLVTIFRPNKSLGKGYSGGVAAAPAAGKIIERTLTYMESKNGN